jgi:hypothetical protein
VPGCCLSKGEYRRRRACNKQNHRKHESQRNHAERPKGKVHRVWTYGTQRRRGVRNRRKLGVHSKGRRHSLRSHAAQWRNGVHSRMFGVHSEFWRREVRNERRTLGCHNRCRRRGRQLRRRRSANQQGDRHLSGRSLCALSVHPLHHSKLKVRTSWPGMSTVTLRTTGNRCRYSGWVRIAWKDVRLATSSILPYRINEKSTRKSVDKNAPPGCQQPQRQQQPEPNRQVTPRGTTSERSLTKSSSVSAWRQGVTFNPGSGRYGANG